MTIKRNWFFLFSTRTNSIDGDEIRLGRCKTIDGATGVRSDKSSPAGLVHKDFKLGGVFFWVCIFNVRLAARRHTSLSLREFENFRDDPRRGWRAKTSNGIGSVSSIFFRAREFMDSRVYVAVREKKTLSEVQIRSITIIVIVKNVARFGMSGVYEAL